MTQEKWKHYVIAIPTRVFDFKKTIYHDNKKVQLCMIFIILLYQSLLFDVIMTSVN